MFATGDYDRFYYDVMERYSDVDIPITFGILIADYDQRMAREYIINYLDVFHKTSGKYIDFFIPGYVPYDAGNCQRIHFKNEHGENYYFSRHLYLRFIEEFKSKFNIDYPYNPILVLAELTGRDFANSKKIIIDLDSDNRNIRQTGSLFDSIFEIAKRHTAIEDFETGLSKTYLKGEWLDSFVRALDNSVVTEIRNQQQNVRSFRIRR